MYDQLIAKAGGDVSKLPIICSEVTGPEGKVVYRVDDIIGEVKFLFTFPFPLFLFVLVLSVISPPILSVF